MRPFGDRVLRYAIEPGLKAGGAAAFVLILAAMLHILPAPGHRPTFKVILTTTFFGVSVVYTGWRLYWRARNPSRYRPTGNAWTIDEDARDARRIALVGLVAGCLTVGLVWISAR